MCLLQTFQIDPCHYCLDSVSYVRHGTWVAHKPGVPSEEPHVLLLRLDEQELVERILVVEWVRELGGSVTSGQG